MKSIIKRSMIISVFPVVIAFFVTMVLTGPFTLEAYVNNLFYFSISIALIGIAMYVIKDGFFDFFAFSFKKVAKALSRDPEYDEKVRFDTNFHLSERISSSYMKPFLYSGLFLSFITIAVAYAL